MNIKIIYFSGTGNTKLVTDKLKSHFESNVCDVELIKAEEALKYTWGKTSLINKTLIGIGFPVYDLLPPKIIMACIDRLPQAKTPIPVFIFSTMALIKGDCNNILARKLKKKGYYTISKTSFLCPSNGVVIYENKNHNRYKSVRFEQGIASNIKKFADLTIAAYKQFNNKEFALLGPVLPHNNIIRFFSHRLFGDKYYRNLEINKNCVNCQLCVKSCPDNNLSYSQNNVTIEKSNGCLRCLRCVTLCPTQAISFTSSPRVDNYSQDLMEELYCKANTFSKKINKME